MRDEQALASLQWHWGDAYRIWYYTPVRWRAERRRHPYDGPLLCAPTAAGLRELIRADYWQVKDAA